jgi:hypothetical protein
MRKTLIVESVLAGLTAALCLSPAIDTAAAREQHVALVTPNKFDGVYSVDVVTEKGSCDKYRWTVAVANGHVTSQSSGGAMLDVVGQIARSGVVLLSFRGQDEIARAAGRMNGKSGAGHWSSASLFCSGSWHARRQD